MARGPLAGASGPGKFSARTDGMNLPSAYYGEGSETESIKGAAKMAQTRGSADPELGRPNKPLMETIPLFSGSRRPDEPITAGIDMGEGPGSEALMYRQMAGQESLSQVLAQMLPYDTNGEIAALYEQAVSRGL
jgi:hypothetical protein